jgi:hypothetical protein
MTIQTLLFLAVAEGGVLVATTDGLLTSFEEVELAPKTLPEVDGTTLLVAIGVDGLNAGIALSTAVTPIARVCVDAASLADF